MSHKRGSVVAVAVLLGVVAVVQLSPWERGTAETREPAGLRSDGEAELDRWWEHVTFLASDSLQGRAAGTPGYDRAARYVEEAFRGEGLRPGTPDGYRDPVGLISRRIDETHSAITLTGATGGVPLALGKDGFFQLGASAPPLLEAPLTFVGYGLHAPEQGHDDLRGLDLRGRVAVFIQGGPRGVAEPLRSHLQSPALRWAAIRRTGAIGWISIPNPRNLDLPFERIARQRLLPGMSLADSTLDDRHGQKVSILMNPASAGSLFEGSPHAFAELLAMADSGEVLPRFPLVRGLRAEARCESHLMVTSNVVGVLPGTDRKLRHEAVVLSAHLDHLGIIAPVNGDSICNGALDNADGVATLLEIARMARVERWRPRRTVLFLACTAEEKGLLGSRAFAARLPRGTPRIVANLNVDMFLPLFPLRQMIVFGDQESDLGPLIASVSARHGVRIQPDPEPLKTRFIRSDQYNFVRQGIPSVAFKIGCELGSPEASLMTAWLHERYHSPSDGLNQPIDRSCVRAFTRILFEATKEVADRADAPRWNPKSIFKSVVARNGGTATTTAAGRSPSQAPPEKER